MKIPFFDTVENALSDLTSTVTRLKDLAEKHRNKANVYQRKASVNHSEADRAQRVADKLNDLVS